MRRKLYRMTNVPQIWFPMILEKTKDSFVWKTITPAQDFPHKFEGNCEIRKGILVLDRRQKSKVDYGELNEFNDLLSQLVPWEKTKYFVEVDDRQEENVFNCQTGDEILNEEREEVLRKLHEK